MTTPTPDPEPATTSAGDYCTGSATTACHRLGSRPTLRANEGADRLLPTCGIPVMFFYAVVIRLLLLAPNLPRRAELSIDGLASATASRRRRTACSSPSC